MGSTERLECSECVAITTQFDDSWQHRSETMRCGKCMHWVAKPIEGGCRAPELGRCRRHSPTNAGWPATFRSDWCGDHKLDEGKL
jgi:ribosomal protein S27E